MTSRHYTVSIHKDGNHVLLYNRTPKQQVLAVACSAFEFLDEKLGHALCGNGIPESWWKINIGKRDYDEEYDILDSSLGSRLYDIQSKFYSKLLDASEGTEVAAIPIDQTLTNELWPEMSFLADDED